MYKYFLYLKYKVCHYDEIFTVYLNFVLIESAFRVLLVMT